MKDKFIYPPRAMNQDEAMVLTELAANGKLTQRELANRLPLLGCHKRFEGEVIPEARQFETTLRKVRQIIRTLRLTYGQPILSDSKGYWICNNPDEAAEVLARMERTAKAQARAWNETYIGMRNVFNIKSKFFEGQLSLEL